MRKKTRSPWVPIAVVGSILVLLWTLFPIYWCAVVALRPPGENRELATTLLPSHPTLDNLIWVWWGMGSKENIRYYLNSILVSVGGTGLALLLGIPAAYAGARWKFRGKRDILFTMLTFRFLPPASVALPLYLFGSYIHLLDTPLILILLYGSINAALVVWVMMSYFRDIPQELEESYMIDGYSRPRAFWKVTLTLSRPGLVAVSMLSIALLFGEFLLAGILTSFWGKTFPVYLSESWAIGRGYEWGKICSLTLYGLAPLIIGFLAVRKHLVRGLTFGVVK